MPLGCVIAGANRHDSPLLRPTLEKLGRFGVYLSDQITVHLDAGYDSNETRALLEELGCEWVIRAIAGRCPGGDRGADEILAQPRLQETTDLHRTPCPGDRGIRRPGKRDHHPPSAHPASLDHLSLEHQPYPTTLTSIRAISRTN